MIGKERLDGRALLNVRRETDITAEEAIIDEFAVKRFKPIRHK